jgi:ATP phosphoribosyltransferase regulatory subunit
MFCGYIEGVAASALVGGRYDNLLKKMGKENLQAMGFAINFYELDRFLKENGGNSVDTVILYDDKSAAFEVMKAVENRRNSGLKVIAEKALPENVKYETVIDLRGNKGEGAKDNA